MLFEFAHAEGGQAGAAAQGHGPGGRLEFHGGARGLGYGGHAVIPV